MALSRHTRPLFSSCFKSHDRKPWQSGCWNWCSQNTVFHISAFFPMCTNRYVVCSPDLLMWIDEKKLHVRNVVSDLKLNLFYKGNIALHLLSSHNIESFSCKLEFATWYAKSMYITSPLTVIEWLQYLLCFSFFSIMYAF